MDEMISAAVRGLIAQRRIAPPQVALAAGLSRSAFFYKLGGERPWKASEVERLSRYFEVSRDSLYEGRADFQASAFGSEGWEFESLRARPSSFPAWRRERRRRHLSVVPLYLEGGTQAATA